MRKFLIDSKASADTSNIAADAQSDTTALAFHAAMPSGAAFVAVYQATSPALANLAAGGLVRAAAGHFPSSTAGATNGGIGQASGAGLTTVIAQTYDTAQGRFEFSGNQDIDGVLMGSAWMATTRSLTYSFPTTGSVYQTPYYNSTFLSNQVPFNSAQAAAVQLAFGLISSYTGLSFNFIGETSTTHANLRFSQTSAGLDSAQASAPGSDPWDGDIWMNSGATNAQPFYSTPKMGNWGMATIMHEIGLALGLKHGNEDYTGFDLAAAGIVDGPGPHYGSAALPSNHDGQAWSLMTFRSDPDNSIMFEGDQFNQPQTYMQDDIAALQYLYGANFTYRSGDTTYGFNFNTGEMLVDGVSQGDPEGNKTFRTIWDGGGEDTYDFSNYAGNATIDLRPGEWSSTNNTWQLANNRPVSGGPHYAPGIVANALLYNGDTRSLIEDALGGSGNDHIIGNQVDNLLKGGLGSDILEGGDGNDLLWGNGETLVSGDVNIDTSANVLAGGQGNDTYVVGNAGDVVIEYSGEGSNDWIEYCASGNYILPDNVENVVMEGNGIVYGNAINNEIHGSNSVYGYEGDDLLSGAGYMYGGVGDDAYFVNSAGDIPVENAGQGTDTIRALVNWTLGSNFENMTMEGGLIGTGNALDNVITGSGQANTLDGADGNDILNGGIGADTLIGGLGNDTFIVDNAGDVVTETASQGTDTVQSSITYTLTTAVENLILTGTATIDGTGNISDNALTGNGGVNALSGLDGNDVIDGGAGADTMTGGLGDDIYYVDDVADIVVEASGQGTDTINTGVTYTLVGRYVEILTLTGTADISATGNSQDNTLNGNSGNNTLSGGFGNDILSGGDGNDVLDGGGNTDTMSGGLGNDSYVVESPTDVVVENSAEGTDSVTASVTYTLAVNIENLILAGAGDINGTGNSANNVLTGNSGNNVLDGGTGADTMTGGTGNDTYVVGNSFDAIIEQAGGGTDLVQSSITFTLAANVENLTLTGSTAINGTGNTLVNTLTGNSAANTLDGAAGADTMTGGTGDDIYYVDNTGDNVVEASGQGSDTILSGVSYGLTGRFIETLTLTGTANINATGNSQVNTLNGNSGDNVLDGGFGADTMAGGAGNDTYYVDDIGDVVTDGSGQGTDIIFSSVSYSLAGRSVENMTLTGSSAINATGNGSNNILIGNGGANILNGGYASDTLTGGGGADAFTFSANSGLDTIADFSAAQGDTIDVHAYYAVAHTLTQSGSDVVIDFGNGDTITVLNVSATDSAFLSHISW